MRKPVTIGINIPGGIDDGQVITIRGKGNAGINGGPAGICRFRCRCGPIQSSNGMGTTSGAICL